MSDSTNKTDLIAQYSQHPLNSEYLRMVAHDVRNRINTLMMANEILQLELRSVKPDALKYTDVIHDSSDNILLILDAAVAAIEGQENSDSQEDK